uniref:Peptidase M17 leucyl aminopeptidase N-terminal domain-containing protein n=1 Tax=Lactuca sativa TaxID=4236 RepID=A0A9R1X084_LACSA|nr:hypothetical protein LSAT_V11C800430740 [Lactuca sativa]
MSSRLQNPFVGAAFQYSLKPRNVNCLGYLGNKFPRKPRYDIIPRAKKTTGYLTGLGSHNHSGKIGFVVKSVKEPFTRSKAIVRSLSTVWEEGLLLFQCSVFYAVISGVCLLLWYSQLKANTLIESKLFPSVCTTLSDYIQCNLHFCKAQSVSPLSITLESCWIGPHKEKFSCGEVPTLKLCSHPFSSLRTRTIVIDAVVYNRTLLAAQKRKYLWLGIPFTDGVLQKHLSTEEGIDNRTKIRRNAREKTATQRSLSVLGTKRVSLIGLGNAPISSSSSIFAYRSLGESVASSAKASQANNVIVALASSQDLTPELKLTTASTIATGCGSLTGGEI